MILDIWKQKTQKTIYLFLVYVSIMCVCADDMNVLFRCRLLMDIDEDQLAMIQLVVGVIIQNWKLEELFYTLPMYQNDIKQNLFHQVLSKGEREGRVFRRLVGLFPRAKPKENPDEQPCQPKENPALPNLFNQILIIYLYSIFLLFYSILTRLKCIDGFVLACLKPIDGSLLALLNPYWPS